MAGDQVWRSGLHGTWWHGGRQARHDGGVIGPIIIVVVLVVALPVAVLMSGALGAALLGFLVKDDVDRSHEGSELLETNV
jgi:hypothetical protein